MTRRTSGQHEQGRTSETSARQDRRARAVVPGTVGILLVACGLLAGCAGGPSVIPPEVAMNATAPFVPTSIRIFPLSHIETTQPQPNKPSRPVVVLHLELKDAYGDAAKALGRLQVTLGRTASGLDPSLEQQELRWDVSELLEPESNAALFDPATRTYRIQLDAPAWVLETIEGTTRNGRTIPPGAVRVRVAFALGTRSQIKETEPIFLTDEFLLQK